jgi:hypothetical protein
MDVGSTCGFTASPDVGLRVTVDTLQTRYSAYMLQAKTKCKACVNTLSCATAAPEPGSLLREGSDVTTCLRFRTPPLRLGGGRRCYVF